jgi:hypothetical protein
LNRAARRGNSGFERRPDAHAAENAMSPLSLSNLPVSLVRPEPSLPAAQTHGEARERRLANALVLVVIVLAALSATALTVGGAG